MQSRFCQTEQWSYPNIVFCVLLLIIQTQHIYGRFSTRQRRTPRSPERSILPLLGDRFQPFLPGLCGVVEEQQLRLNDQMRHLERRGYLRSG